MNAKERKQIGKLSERVSDELAGLIQEIQEIIQEFVDNQDLQTICNYCRV